MARYPGFIGASATVRSRNANAERTVNWYPEVVPGTGKVRQYLVPTPGLEPFVVLGSGPVRALFAQDGRAFAVGGASFYELFAVGTSTWRGTVASDGRPATISSNGTNGNQLFITSGGLGYIYNLTTNVLSQIAAAGFPDPVAMGAFSDGYFLALQSQSNQFYVSTLYDGTQWDSLDVGQVSTVSDHVSALVESHRDIWLLGTQTSSVWSNVGDADFPYAPMPGVKIDQGTGAAYSVVGLDNSLFWLGQSVHGARVVWKANGYTPQRVSTHAVEFALAQARRVDDAIGYGYQEDGHTFYVLYVPDLANVRTWGTTWVYDVATDQWHERAIWDSVRMDWQPHLGRCHAFGFGKHLVGDRLSPAIYDMRLGLSSDTQVLVS